MGSLMRDQRWVVMDKSSPPSPLTPFHQRQNNNRSPLESPPIAKKLPKVKDGDLFFGHMFVNVPTPPHSAIPSSSPSSLLVTASADGKENRSILKVSGGGGQRSIRPSRSPGGRRVDFEQDVVVCHFDRTEGGHVGWESQKLSSDTKDRKEFINRTLQGKGRPGLVVTDSPSPKTSSFFFGRREPPILYAEPIAASQQYQETFPVPASHYGEPHPAVSLPVSSLSISSSPVTSHSMSPLPATSLRYDQPTSFSVSTLDHRGPPLQVPSSLTEDHHGGYLPTSDDVDFSFFEDDQHSLRLKFTVPLGEGVAANDVLVKANTNGNKVRLVGTRTIGTSRHGTIIRQEFTERYQLPMDVDPYMITARMDNSGNLYVEAPVMTPDRKRALAVERQTMNETRMSAISDFVL